uniref:Uncharacterized protein n=1 Tax=Meloidogyne enterolobii TaxID=390850 RepID=A0A6V7WU01_MELEN|nr:unnamed protein product [Meloidogyne enterolobii]
MANIRKRLTEAEARERELHERLERRERHIEQMGRVQSDKLADNDKLNIALRQWRIERDELTKKTIRTEEEKQAINTRYSEAINRLDLLAKENKSLQKRIAHLQQNELKISEQLQQTQKQIIEDKEEKKKELKEINTQTDDLIIPSFSIPPTTPRTFLESEREFNILRESQLNETNKFNKFIEVEERERKLKNENRALIKDLRKAELYQRETAEQLNSLKQKHSQLLEDYNNLFKIGKDFNKKSLLKEDNEIVGIVLLKDKLAARERELELFRRKIIELERKIWHFEMERN